MTAGGIEKRQVARNAATNLVVLAAYSVATLLFTPYLIHRLGLDLFGLVPLAMSLSTYVGVLTVGIQSAVGRYLTVEVARQNEKLASRVFSTALMVNLGMAGVIAPVLLGISIAAPRLFEVPAGAEGDARWFFAFAMTSYVLTALREVVGAATYSVNRMDLQNVARLVEIALRVGVPVAYFELSGPSLVVVGVGMAAGSLAALAVGVWSWKRYAAAVRLARGLFDRGKLKEMLGTGTWVTVSHVGSLLHMATDVVVINVVLGATVAGAYGSALQLSSFLRSLAGALAVVLGPVLFSQFAKGRLDALGSTAAHAVRLLGVALGLPVALIAGFARPVLGLWLGPELEVVAPVLAVMMLHLAFNYSVLPLDSVGMALDRMKWPAIVSVSTGVLNVALSVLLARTGGWAIGVAVATAISLSLKNALFTPAYIAGLLEVPRSRLFGAMLTGGVLSLLGAAAAYASTRIFEVASWPSLAAAALAVAAVYAVAAWGILGAEERGLLRSMAGGLSGRMAR